MLPSSKSNRNKNISEKVILSMDILFPSSFSDIPADVSWKVKQKRMSVANTSKDKQGVGSHNDDTGWCLFSPENRKRV